MLLKLYIQFLETLTSIELKHFNTKSFAIHEALGYFLENIPDLKDDLFETILADSNITFFSSIKSIKVNLKVDNYETRLENLKILLSSYKFETPVNNIVDDILTLITLTQYKLNLS